METFLQAVNPTCTAFSNAIEKCFVDPLMFAATWLTVPAIVLVIVVWITKMITRRP